jgi:hypothetical protein
MTVKETNEKLRENGKCVEEFWHWMKGKTVKHNDDFTEDIYEEDVDMFIREKDTITLDK